MTTTIHPDCPNCWCRDGEPCSCRCHNHDEEGDESPRGWDTDNDSKAGSNG
jgi:hypothetical protein